MATQTNTPNSVEEQDAAHNVAQDLYNREFNSMVGNYGESADDSQEDANIAKGTHKDDYGDTVQNNPNADVKSREEDGDSLYNKNDSSSAKGSKGKFNGGLGGKLQKGGPTGGVIGLLLFGIVGMGGGSIGLASSLLVNMKEIFHNDRSDATRANRLYSRAFMSNKFDKGKPCTGSKIKCKMTTMSRDQIKKFKEAGYKIKGKLIKPDGTDSGQKIEDDRSLDTDNGGNTAQNNGGSAGPNANAPPVDETTRGVITDIETPEGDTAHSGKELYQAADRNKSTLRSLDRVLPNKAAFYLNKFFDKVLTKFHGFTKGKKTFPEDNKDGAQDDAFNNQTAQDESNRAQDVRQAQQEDGEENNPNNQAPSTNGSQGQDNTGNGGSSGGQGGNGGNGTQNNGNGGSSGSQNGNSGQGGGSGTPDTGDADNVIDEAGKSVIPKKVRGGAALVIQGICAVYKTSRAINTAVAVQQVARLGAFALLFFQAADEIKNGIADGPKVTYMSNNLTYYESNEKENGKDNPKYNKTATDSDGYKIAATGNTSALKDYAKKYMIGNATILGITVATSAITKTVQNLASLGGSDLQGRKNVKTFCRAVNNPNVILGSTLLACGSAATNPLSAAGCYCGLDGPGCKEAIEQAVKGGIVAARKAGLSKLLATALRGIDATSSTKGVDAGNAIAAGAGAVLSVAGSGYGMKPAKKVENGKDSNPEISNYIAYTQPLENTYIALEKDDARNNPLDMTNQYSMLGTLVRSFDVYSATPTSLLGNASTLASALPSAFNSLFTGQQVSALYSQPSTARDGASGRYKNCDKDANEDLDYIGAVGDSFCSVVNVTSVSELKKAQKTVDDPNDDSLDKLVDYMTQKGAEGDKAKSDTKESASNGASCTTTDGDDTPTCSNSEEASIDDDGQPKANSQYEKYLRYCTQERKDPWGAQSAAYEQGTDRDQRWYTGEECMKGNDGDADSGEARMLKNFRAWTNYCLQSGTMDGTSSCYEDDATQEEDSAQPVGSIAEVAKQMGAWGGQYNSCYIYGGGHSKDEAWIREAINSHFTGNYAVDCSAFVRAVILQATSKDIGDQNTNSMCADTRNFQQIPRAQAKPGDLAIDCSSHVEVITDPNGGRFKTVGSHTDGCGPGFGASPGDFQGGSFVLRYKG